MNPFYIDKTPVTCAEFKRFLDATRYHPEDDHNSCGAGAAVLPSPAGRTNRSPGFRLKTRGLTRDGPASVCRTSGEWQYAAQGTEGRAYPWGNERTTAASLLLRTAGCKDCQPTWTHTPQGVSAFGVLDLVGNVWQWTDEFQDDHTRAAILKGGSYYRPDKSGWYFPQARELTQHGKYLLLAPSLDRSATIGFRCVADAQ